MTVGASVFAIGNPQNLGWSHTQGVISQLRTQEIESRKVRVIQTQAAINPGNSGGGLYDQQGYLLAINSWGADKSISEGLGFAIALDSLLELAPPQLESPNLDDRKSEGPTRP
jgi:serine protease Do